MTPLVSIGIPSLDNENWVRTAVETALAQTWPNKEVIVIDAGADEQTREMLRGFGERIRLLPAPSATANHARNLILEEARGEWLQYLDPEDYLLPGKISAQLDGPPADAELLYSPMLEESADGRAQRIARTDTGADPITQWMAWELPKMSGALWRRDVLRRLDGWSEKLPCCQDYELYARALRAHVRFAFRHEPGAVSRRRADEDLWRRDPRLVVDIKTGLIDEMCRWCTGRTALSRRQRDAAAQACFEMARILARKDLQLAERYLKGRKRRGLVHLAGPAAPTLYRLVYRLTNFAFAERAAGLFGARTT